MKSMILRVSIVILFFSLWELLPTVGVVNPNFLTPVSGVLKALRGLLLSGELITHLMISLKRILFGLGLAIVIGCPLGIIMGWFRSLEMTIDAPLQAGRQVSALALFPVFILFFGIGEISKVIIIFWASVWSVLLNTVAGVKNIDPLLIKSARSFGAKGTTLFRKVILPAIAPSIFTGIRLGASYAFMVLVAAEMIGANSGLGFLILNSQEVFKIPEMYAGIVALGLFGLIVNNILLAFEKQNTGWKEARDTE
jgi:NitT/TauT family transport system permease protein